VEDIMLKFTATHIPTPGQFEPDGLDFARWTADWQRFLALLEAEGLDFRLYESAFNPYPFLVGPDRVRELRALQGSIHRAIFAVVTHFAKDDRLSRVIQLPRVEQEILSVLSGKPYRPGSFRPDYLHASDGREMISEINGRFTLNGYISSVLLNRCAPRLYSELSPLPALEKLEPTLCHRLGEGRVGILKASEHGWDIHHFQARWGPDCEMLHPKDLSAAHLARWRGVVLELHQRELLSEVPAGLRAQLAAHPGVLNDLRTIFIGHDKRLLALLSTDRVLEDYLEPNDVARLRRHVIPTWVKGAAPEKVREALAHPVGWLAKPPRSGKGQGIVLSSRMSPDQWRHTLQKLPDDYVLQPFIEQRLFSIAMIRDGDLVKIPMRVIGVLPTLDEHAFGPGVYRAAADEIVNVARGGIMLAPALPGGVPCLH
jgi:hypothetical protein